jgi:tetratricopeptide (TPR) repeat protein
VTAPKKDILQGWKDIAAYVARDVRTVKRWEKQRGLPVRRMPGAGRANVYALIPDLDSWLSSGVPIESEAEIAEDIEVAEADASLLPESAAVEPLPVAIVAQPADRPVPNPQHRWIYIVAGVVCLGVVVASVLAVRAHHHEQTATDIPPFSPTQTVRTVKYSSRIAGVDALYLRGIYFYEQRTPDTLDRALKCFQQAIDKDPGYAPAYAGLAQAYNLVREYSVMPEAEAYAKAETAARRAIELDPNLSEAHASLGFVEFFWDMDPASAEREFHTAIALDPNSALAHHWYGSVLTHQGRFDEALTQLDLAQRLQPTSTSILCDRAFALGLNGHRNEAADLLQEVINEEPDSGSPHRILANISLVEPRDIPRFLDENRRAAMLRHDPKGVESFARLDAAYHDGGAPAMWRAQLTGEEQAHPSPNDRTYGMASAEAALGLNEDSLRDLKQMADRRDRMLIAIAMDPVFMPLHNDPRFIAIAARVGVQIRH